jgi:hypothetical protein
MIGFGSKADTPRGGRSPTVVHYIALRIAGADGDRIADLAAQRLEPQLVAVPSSPLDAENASTLAADYFRMK